MSNYKRCFPLEGSFMEYKIKDLLYGYLQYKSTFDEKNKELYITHKKYLQMKPELANLCGCSTRTVEREIQKLEDAALIKWVETKEGTRIVITAMADRYQLIDYDMLEYLLNTRNHNTIRIYVYLLNKYLWKRQTDDNYIFTLSELITAIGYKSVGTSQTESMRRVIDSLEREGIIKTSIIKQSITREGKVIPVQRFVLNFVAEHERELTKIERKVIKQPPVYQPRKQPTVCRTTGFVF